MVTKIPCVNITLSCVSMWKGNSLLLRREFWGLLDLAVVHDKYVSFSFLALFPVFRDSGGLESLLMTD